jgi:hypothetical protein
MIRIPGSGQGYAKTISFGVGLGQELAAASNSGSGDFVSLVATYANVLWRKLPVSGTEPVESVPGEGGISSPTGCEFRYALQTAVSFLRTSSIE